MVFVLFVPTSTCTTALCIDHDQVNDDDVRALREFAVNASIVFLNRPHISRYEYCELVKEFMPVDCVRTMVALDDLVRALVVNTREMSSLDRASGDYATAMSQLALALERTCETDVEKFIDLQADLDDIRRDVADRQQA